MCVCVCLCVCVCGPWEVFKFSHLLRSLFFLCTYLCRLLLGKSAYVLDNRQVRKDTPGATFHSDKTGFGRDSYAQGPKMAAKQAAKQAAKAGKEAEEAYAEASAEAAIN